MPKPDSCPQKLYEIMLNCWNEEPSSRPMFQMLHSQLQLLSAGNDQRSTAELSKTNEKEVLNAGKGIEDSQLQCDHQLVFQAKNDEISSLKAQIQRLNEQLKRNQTTLQNAVLRDWDTDNQVTLVKKLDPDSFTSTWRGTWKGGTKVTVKVHEAGTSVATFLQDAMVMANLRHPNILQLLAVFRKKRPFLNVCEFIKPENLLDYLRSHPSTTHSQLLTLCQQIANGMSYMESRHYIHGNLQAKNVFLTDNLTCKVANFSHSDAISDEEMFITPSDAENTIKWSPPEVLVAHQHTRKSDVWSFGIVLYEVITYGLDPYIGMADSDVILEVKQGYRMPQPLACPDKLYGMMLNCWQEKPESRPTFQSLLAQLESFTGVDKTSDDSRKQQKTGLTAQTLHPFSAAKSGDMSFDANEIITDVEQVEPTGWWKGKRKLDGTEGYFPSNYVKLV